VPETKCEAKQRRRLWIVQAILALLMVLILVIDFVTPPFYNLGVFYLGLVWLAYALATPREVWWTAVFGGILTLVEVFLSSGDGVIPFFLFNRSMTVVCIALAAWLFTRVTYSRTRLQERENYCTSILNSLLDAMISMDAAGRIFDWNAQASAVFGWTAEEAIGRDLAETIMPERYREKHRNGLRAYLQTGQSRIVGKRLHMVGLRKCGDEFPVELSVAAIRQQGQPVFNAFLRDISRQEADATYRKRMGELVDSSWDAIIGRRHDGMIESWNAGATRVYGYLEEEVLGKSIAFLLPEGATAEEAEISVAMLSGQRLEQFETLRRRKDGVVVPVAITVSPIRDEQGNVVGSSSIERDITLNREREAELQAAKSSAERANRSRADFLANVSHELRTPMNAIIGMTQLALTEELGKDAREFVQTANRAAHSLLALLNDILDYSRLESGKFAIIEEPFFVRTLVAETTATLASLARTKGIRLTTRIDDAVPRMLVGDGLRLRQILLNLLGNAIKFTPEGDVTLRIIQLASGGGRVQLRFSVRDTGIGISPSDQERIVKPFEQGNASRSRTAGGTGLGLAITAELLGLMDSKLAVTSEAGEGSEFSFDLWLETGKQELSTKVTLAAMERLRNLHVLVVGKRRGDESPVENMLARWETRVGHAGTREQASEMAKSAARRSDPFRLAIVVRSELVEADTTGTPLWLDPAMSGMPMIKILRDEEVGVVDSADAQPQHVVLLRGPVTPTTLLECVLGLLAEDQAPSGGMFPPLVPGAVSSRSLQVLLAEDVPANQRLVTAVLSRRGHRTEVVTNGRDAVNLFRAKEFDLILMDVQMPGMDGYESARAIRNLEQEGSRRIPIIAMTAHAFGEDRERCMTAGMDDYISKPFDVGRLVAMVEAHGSMQFMRQPDGGAATSLNEPGSWPNRNSREESATATMAQQQPGLEADSSGMQVLDMSAAMQRLGGDWSLFRDLAEFFGPDCEAAMKESLQGIATRDHRSVCRAAHTVKGLASAFDGNECVSAATELEQAVLNANWESAVRLHDQLAGAVSRFARALRHYVDTH
jgi:two-component system, sensor histidine kinase and response regulator